MLGLKTVDTEVSTKGACESLQGTPAVCDNIAEGNCSDEEQRCLLRGEKSGVKAALRNKGFVHKVINDWYGVTLLTTTTLSLLSEIRLNPSDNSPIRSYEQIRHGDPWAAARWMFHYHRAATPTHVY